MFHEIFINFGENTHFVGLCHLLYTKVLNFHWLKYEHVEIFPWWKFPLNLVLETSQQYL